MYLMMSNTCYGNNTVFNKEDIDSGAASGITCTRKGSTSLAGILMNQTGGVVACHKGAIQCEIGEGSLTFFTYEETLSSKRNGMYTCCIDSLCISARIYKNSAYDNFLSGSELQEF